MMVTGRILFHSAIADDWASSIAFGLYEAATHSRSLEE
jgi:hypothetical protein